MASKVKLNAASGGSVTIQPVDTAGNYTTKIPAAGGVAVIADSATGAMQLPVGTTAQRPASPQVGWTRFNSTLGYAEIYNGTTWTGFFGYSAAFLVVAGGGGGYSAGGGAGGMLASTIKLTPGTAYTITVGAGGAATTGSAPYNGSIGGTSSIGSVVVATGGGGGSGYYGSQTGGNGGSGGGGYSGSGSAGTGISGQGFRGGYFDGSQQYGYPAGGGAGGVGGNNSGPYGAGAGGRGLYCGITGAIAYYAGGGGGGADTNYGNGGAGGEGGGGGSNQANQNGVANTGGGGGGGWYGATARNAGAGGSGVVIIAYQSLIQLGSGGTVTSYTEANTGLKYWVHTFTTSGTYTA